MSDPLNPIVQRVVVTASTPPSDDVTIEINGQAYGGWQDVRITRGIERLPSDFGLRLTDFYAADADLLQIKPGDSCVVKIGKTKVLTGYVDVVSPSISSRSHDISVSGRSKCADLVDCSAEWPGGQISGSSLLELARKLGEPYGIDVDTDVDVGPPIPKFNLNRGDSAFEIIERLCRFRQLLAYDDADGNLFLTRTSTQRAASGFREGVNVQTANAVYSSHDQFSEYRCYLQPVAKLLDLGGGGDLIASRVDQTVLRHRVKIMIAEASGGGIGGYDVAADRVSWEASRRYGRSSAIRITTDAWRDRSGALYEPNTLVPIDIPSLKITGKLWTIGEVTYRKGEQGTLCDLLIMPPQAFNPAPAVFDTSLSADVASLPTGIGLP